MKPTKKDKKKTKKKRTISVDCDIGQILIITTDKQTKPKPK